jgi:acetate kinase
MAKYGLIIQPKSHTLSLEIFKFPEIKSIWRASAKNLNQKNSFIIESANQKNQLNFQQGLNFVSAFRQLVKIIPKNIYGDLIVVGHPVVNLGPQSAILSILNKSVLKQLKRWLGLAPTDSLTSLAILTESLNIFPGLKQWVISDTAFFNHLPLKAALCALPIKIQEKFNLQKIGQQGLVHQFLLQATANKLKVASQKLNVVTIYLNTNCSICLMQNGQVIDTTGGFGLTAGLFAATTSGSLDPSSNLSFRSRLYVKRN